LIVFGLPPFPFGLRAQSPDAKDLLLLVRQNVVATVNRLPKYVCTQTIERARYEPEAGALEPDSKRKPPACDDIIARVHRKGWKRRLTSSDRVRVDVAVSRNIAGVDNEMYSWPGEDRFSSHSLFELVRDGAVSTGSFSCILGAVFGSHAARFSYQGDKATLSVLGFRVSKEDSQYMYFYGNSPREGVVVPYDGTVFVDPQSGDPERLIIRSGELPPETGVCEVTQELQYGRVRLNGAEFLLPTEVRSSFTRADETEAENRIRYSACREYTSEVRFDANPGRASVVNQVTAAPPAPLPALPAGLPFKVVFTERINTATAAAGDLIRGRLKTAIRDPSWKLIAAEGTPVTGRIMRIRRLYSRSRPVERRQWQNQAPSLVVDIRLETLDAGERVRPLKANFDSGDRRLVSQASPIAMRVDIGSLERAGDRAPDSDLAIFEFWDDSPNYVVKGPLESRWVTAEP
jgi:hypothetical protein